MTKLVLLFIAASAAVAPATAATPMDFQRDGVHYVGTATEHGGVQHIVGHEVVSGRSFDLTVVNGRVSGVYDGYQVSYFAPKPTVVASR